MSVRRLRRGRALLALVVLLAMSVLAIACSSGDGSPDSGDHSSQFASFEPAPEPNGDLSKVVWPDFVIQAGPEIQALYAFNVEHGDLMRYMPCFCGCEENGHHNNRDCYIRSVHPDGSVEFDSMAPT